MNNDSINIFGSPIENRVNIFSSPTSQDVDIFSNNARVSQSASSFIDIFSQINTSPEVNIFGGSTQENNTIDIFSQENSAEINIFAENTIDIFNSDATAEEVNIFNNSDVSSKFTSLIVDLNNENLTNIASLVTIAKDIYFNGV